MMVPTRLGSSSFYNTEFWKLHECYELRAEADG